MSPNTILKQPKLLLLLVPLLLQSLNIILLAAAVPLVDDSLVVINKNSFVVRHDLDIETFYKTLNVKRTPSLKQKPASKDNNNNRFHSLKKERQEVAIPDPFKFEFSCNNDHVDESRCEKARKGFIEAGKLISKQLLINTQIVVNASFDSFCNGQGRDSCELGGTLGLATPTSFFEGRVKGSEEFFQYPQALAKQLSHTDVPYAKFDLMARFNADFEFHFKDDPLPISNEATDFQYVVVHELQHGLGLISGWVNPQLAELSDLYIPEPDIDEELGRVYGWKPLPIFDKFLVDATTGSTYLDEHTPISKFSFDGLETVEDFTRNLRNSGEPYKAARKMYIQATTPNSTIFRTDTTTTPTTTTIEDNNDNNSTLFVDLYIYTPTEFSSGSTFSHIDTFRYQRTPEFLCGHAVDIWSSIPLERIIMVIRVQGY